MIRYALLLIFRPTRFIESATQHAVEHELSFNPNRDIPPDRVNALKKTARDQTERIRASLIDGIVRTSITIFLGIVTGLILAHWVGTPSKLLVYIAQALGAAVILGATLGEISRDIQTIDGGTLPELVNAWTFRALYVIGTFLFVASFAWDVALDVNLR